MCLILLAWKTAPGNPLIVAANRDEFHARPAQPASFWDDHPAILAGRDLQAKGTWMGVARSGRFAAVTNYRGAREPAAERSRGALVAAFLSGSARASLYAEEVAHAGASYSGFNLLICDGAELWWVSNRDGAPRSLAPGVYGLGNLLLDSPEVEADKARFRGLLSPSPSVELLFEVLGPAKVLSPQYGTRCSTAMLGAGTGRVRYAERSFSPDGTDLETVQFEF